VRKTVIGELERAIDRTRLEHVLAEGNRHQTAINIHAVGRQSAAKLIHVAEVVRSGTLSVGEVEKGIEISVISSETDHCTFVDAGHVIVIHGGHDIVDERLRWF